MRCLAFVLILSLPLWADELVLRNGASFSGVVRERGDQVTLELDFGTMTFPKSDVRSITKTEDPLREYAERLAGARDAKGYYEVGLWAQEKGLSGRAAELFRKVIALDPDHEGARKALGFEKLDGQWLDGDLLMMARGFLKYDGRWLPKDTVEKKEALDAQLSIETGRLQSEERLAGMAHDLESARIQLGLAPVGPVSAPWGAVGLGGFGGFGPGRAISAFVPFRVPPRMRESKSSGFTAWAIRAVRARGSSRGGR